MVVLCTVTHWINYCPPSLVIDCFSTVCNQTRHHTRGTCLPTLPPRHSTAFHVTKHSINNLGPKWSIIDPVVYSLSPSLSHTHTCPQPPSLPPAPRPPPWHTLCAVLPGLLRGLSDYREQETSYPQVWPHLLPGWVGPSWLFVVWILSPTPITSNSSCVIVEAWSPRCGVCFSCWESIFTQRMAKISIEMSCRFWYQCEQSLLIKPFKQHYFVHFWKRL